MDVETVDASLNAIASADLWVVNAICGAMDCFTFEHNEVNPLFQKRDGVDILKRRGIDVGWEQQLVLVIYFS